MEQTCKLCGDAATLLAGHTVCGSCLRAYPRELVKAAVWDKDGWAFACGLVSGTVIRFTGAEIKGDYVKLSGVEFIQPKFEIRDVCFGRGLTVRLDDISWVADGGR